MAIAVAIIVALPLVPLMPIVPVTIAIPIFDIAELYRYLGVAAVVPLVIGIAVTVMVARYAARRDGGACNCQCDRCRFPYNRHVEFLSCSRQRRAQLLICSHSVSVASQETCTQNKNVWTDVLFRPSAGLQVRPNIGPCDSSLGIWLALLGTQRLVIARHEIQ